MNQLWAPWRMAYINGIDGKGKGCVFCTKPEGNNNRENLILHRGKKCFVIMNLFPYNKVTSWRSRMRMPPISAHLTKVLPASCGTSSAFHGKP